MKRAPLITLIVLISVATGIGVGRYWFSDRADSADAAAGGEREILYWKAPMDPNYRSE